MAKKKKSALEQAGSFLGSIAQGVAPGIFAGAQKIAPKVSAGISRARKQVADYEARGGYKAVQQSPQYGKLLAESTIGFGKPGEVIPQRFRPQVQKAVESVRVPIPGFPNTVQAPVGKAVSPFLFETPQRREILARVQGGGVLTPAERRQLSNEQMALVAGLSSPVKAVPKPNAAVGNLAQGFIKAAQKPISRKVAREAVEATPTVEARLLETLRGAAPLARKQTEALYSAERGRRLARAMAVGEKVRGEAGFNAQLGQLKGSLPKAQFESIKQNFTQKDVDYLFDKVRTQVPGFDQITAETGLRKLLGVEGGEIPTRNEIELLGKVFGRELTKELLKKRPIMQRIIETSSDVLNIPRSAMATADLSAPLRQGVFLIGRPKQWVPAFKEMFRYAASEKAYKELLDEIASRPTYQAMRQNGLALTDLGISPSSREEAFASNLLEQVPGIGKVVRGSGRAYSGFLNKLRADVFDDILRGAQNSGTEITPQLQSDLADFINAATGRGNFRGALKPLNQASVALNSTLFSPRLLASRLNLLDPTFYMGLDPTVRKEALKSLFSFAGTGMTVLTLAKLAGADVGADPRSADFGKIKIGNTRYDIWGGFQQPIRLAAQLLTGQSVNSTTGKTYTLGEGYKPRTRADIVGSFLESKLNPTISFALGLLRGKTPIGEKFNVSRELEQRFTPLIAQTLIELAQEGSIPGLAGVIPAAFGVGVQTYDALSQIENKGTVSSLLTKQKFTPNDLKVAKKAAIGYYLKGDVQRAKEVKNRFKINVSQKDINDFRKKAKNDALEAYVRGDKEYALKTKKEAGFTISQADVAKAAKSYAIELYREGKTDEALELKRKYGFNVSQKDIQ